MVLGVALQCSRSASPEEGSQNQGFQDSQPTHTLPSWHLIHTFLPPQCDHNGSTLTLSGKYIIILRPLDKYFELKSDYCHNE